MSFVAELKRRNVFRVAIAYLVGSWLALQVIDVVGPLLDLSDTLGRAVLIILAIGFPIALILAWVYELTPEGVKPESEVDRSQSITPTTGRKLDFAIIGVLTVAVVFFALERFVWSGADVRQERVGQTIAVLPFVNMSSDPEQEYLSDGLAEELLNLLVRIPELSVTSRSTAFSYKGKDYRIPDVGRELGVDHVLEGSVRRSGNQVRISARLVETASDAQVWSESWERTLNDVFAIQDEIAQAVVEGMRVTLVGEVPKTERTDPEAYALYLQAGEQLNKRTAANALEAERLLVRALEIDPDFVPGWLRLSRTYQQGGAVGAWHPDQSFPLVRSAATEVQRLDPDNVEALTVLSGVALGYYYDLNSAAAYLARARELDPGNQAVRGMEAVTAFMVGDYETSIPIREEFVVQDPENVNGWYGLGQNLLVARRFEDAGNAFRRAIELSPSSAGSHFYLAAVHILEGNFAAALAEVPLETRDGYRAMGWALLYQAQGRQELADQALQELIDLGYRWTYQIAAVHAFRNEADEAFKWLDRAIGRRDTSLFLIVGDPFMDNIRDYPQFDVILERLGRAPAGYRPDTM